MLRRQQLSPVLGLLLHSFNCFLSCIEIFEFYEIPLANSWLEFLGKWSSVQKVLSTPMSFWVLSVFPSSNFSVTAFKLESLIDLELILMRDNRSGSNFILLCSDLGFQNYLLKILSFLQCILGPLCPISDG